VTPFDATPVKLYRKVIVVPMMVWRGWQLRSVAQGSPVIELFLPKVGPPC
jgi:hypothetical protein